MVSYLISERYLFSKIENQKTQFKQHSTINIKRVQNNINHDICIQMYFWNTYG